MPPRVTDMCLDSRCTSSSELQAAALYPIDPSRPDVTTERYKAVCKGYHACLELAGTETANDGNCYCWLTVTIHSMLRLLRFQLTTSDSVVY